MKRFAILFLLVAACSKQDEPVTEKTDTTPPAETYTSTTTAPVAPTPTPPAAMPAEPKTFHVKLEGKTTGTVDFLDQEAGAKVSARLDQPVTSTASISVVSACGADGQVLAEIGAIEKAEVTGTLPTGQALEGKFVSIRDKDGKELACGPITAASTDTGTPTTPGPIPPQPAY